MTRTEIKKYIKKKYNIESEALWADLPTYIVFRNNKKKWFGIIIDVMNKTHWVSIDTDRIYTTCFRSYLVNLTLF